MLGNVFSKKMENAFAQNKLLVQMKTIVFCGAVGEHINSNLPGTMPQAI